jgi:SAM-dependent methyltransferase
MGKQTAALLKDIRDAQRYGWDAGSEAYDRSWVPQIEPLTRHCVDRAGLRAGECVLDLATGTGVGAFAAAAAVGPSGAVTGIDVSERMVALAAARARASRARNVDFRRADMEATGAADGGYHAVSCAFGLMFAADLPAAFAELARVTAPGGRVSVCVWGQRAACGFADVFPIVDSRIEGDACPLLFSLGVPGALAIALWRAGLEVTGEERVGVTLGWASADDVCDALLAGGAVALAWNHASPEVRAEVRAALIATIEPFRRGERYDIPAEVVFATARKGTSRSAAGHAFGVKSEADAKTNERTRS